jgi:hypothetical protein
VRVCRDLAGGNNRENNSGTESNSSAENGMNLDSAENGMNQKGGGCDEGKHKSEEKTQIQNADQDADCGAWLKGLEEMVALVGGEIKEKSKDDGSSANMITNAGSVTNANNVVDANIAASVNASVNDVGTRATNGNNESADGGASVETETLEREPGKEVVEEKGNEGEQETSEVKGKECELSTTKIPEEGQVEEGQVDIVGA